MIANALVSIFSLFLPGSSQLFLAPAAPLSRRIILLTTPDTSEVFFFSREKSHTQAGESVGSSHGGNILVFCDVGDRSASKVGIREVAKAPKDMEAEV